MHTVRRMSELKQVENPIEWGLYYDKAEVDEAIAEIKAENVRLKAENKGLKDENARLMSRPCYVCKEEQVKDFEKVIAEKDRKIRRLYRALYKVCAKWAFLAQWERGELVENWEKWENVERKCGAKAKEYK